MSETVPPREAEAIAKLRDALKARETPFRIAQTVTACWCYAIGDDDGAAYGLVENGAVLWRLIEAVVEHERKAEPE
jgi:hypothetical protein